MTDPSPPPGYSPGPNAPPPPMWVPMPPPLAGPRAIPWNMLAVLALIIGFALVFIGTLVIIAWGSPPASCGAVPPTCSLSDYQMGLLNSMFAGKILWAFGLAGIGCGAGIKLHWGPKVVRGSPAEEYAFVSGERRRYTFLFALSLVLLAILMLSISSLGLRAFGL